MHGYTFLKSNWKTGPSGGVGLYLKNGLQYRRREDLENSLIESIWIEVFVFKTKSILFGCYYLKYEPITIECRNYTNYNHK